MKTRMLALVLLFGCALTGRADWQQEYAAVLKKYVGADGVRYGAWKKNTGDMEAIQRVTDGIAASKQTDLAFYLNAYNAWILHEALAKYPTKSVKDPLFTFFLKDRIVVGGRKMSFNALEKEVIRGGFKEPRVHFALNCASQSCPPLNSEPFRGSDLEAVLDKLATEFVNSERGMRMDGEGVALSKIFDWYKEDFGGSNGVIRFINQRRKQPLATKVKITFQEYNWNLNETK
ncbi:MAG: hypothetical protein QOD99_645 [Chthoniobacter sp.]|jgi:hypothetical protein|nr:hypothetical protein [Chthoniobacter sp.]